MKLVKAQKEILVASLEVFDARGENVKPISMFGRISKEDNYAKAFMTYANKMEDLADAGLIVRDGKFGYLNLDRIDEIRTLVA